MKRPIDGTNRMGLGLVPAGLTAYRNHRLKLVSPADLSAAGFFATEFGRACLGQVFVPTRVAPALAVAAGFRDSRLATPTGIADAELANSTAATTADMGNQAVKRLRPFSLDIMTFPFGWGDAHYARACHLGLDAGWGKRAGADR